MCTYLIIVQECCWVLLLLQSLQSVLELCLKVLHLTEDRSLCRTTWTLTLYSNILAVNNLVRAKYASGQNRYNKCNSLTAHSKRVLSCDTVSK